MKVLIIGYVWPEPRSSAAGSRTLQLIRCFRESGWPVVFATAAVPTERMANLEELGVTTAEIAANDSGFDAFVQANEPDLVLFDRFIMEEQFGWRVELACPTALRVLDTVDLHLLRRARQQAVKEARELAPEELVAGDSALREVASIFRSDLTLVISTFEYSLLTSQFAVPPALLHHLPFVMEVENLGTSVRGFDERSGFVWIGNFRHEPNADAVSWIKQSIWPEIKRLRPQSLLRIYGDFGPNTTANLPAGRDGVEMMGWTPDAGAVLSSARVCLAPMRFGAGIKGKLADAMVSGTPSVTTPVGAEGMTEQSHMVLEWPGLIADTPAEIARAAVRLHEDPALWADCQSRGFALVRKNFDRRRLEPELMDRLGRLQSDLPASRTRNFVGAMLRHHHHRSTEYMSRWIEAKSRFPR